MRTTITVDDDLVDAAKQVAARTGRTLSAVFEDALRQALGRQGAEAWRRPPLPSFRGDGLHPGVDLDDMAALLDTLDQDDAAR